MRSAVLPIGCGRWFRFLMFLMSLSLAVGMAGELSAQIRPLPLPRQIVPVMAPDFPAMAPGFMMTEKMVDEHAWPREFRVRRPVDDNVVTGAVDRVVPSETVSAPVWIGNPISDDPDFPSVGVDGSGGGDPRVKIPVLPTLGGSGTWSDCLIFHDWRIQRHLSSGECRLLDARNFRLIQGNYAQCREALSEMTRRENLPPMRGRAVVLLHGLATTRYHMSLIGDYLKKQGGYTIINISYATTQADIGSHAQRVAEVIVGLPELEEIHFVAHSMGNIVLRRYFADELRRTGGKIDLRFGRCVMIGPPNQGAQAARMLHDNPLFEKTFGAGADQLGAQWPELQATLVSPPIPFGVVAGGVGNSFGFNLLLPGDDDGVVRIEEAHLEGEAAFRRLPILHSLLPQSPEVHKLTLRFLETGSF